MPLLGVVMSGWLLLGVVMNAIVGGGYEWMVIVGVVMSGWLLLGVVMNAIVGGGWPLLGVMSGWPLLVWL